MRTLQLETTQYKSRSTSLFVFPFFACSVSTDFSELSKLTQLAAKGYRLPQWVKIPILRVPLAILAVVADMSVILYLNFPCHSTYTQWVTSHLPIKQFWECLICHIHFIYTLYTESYTLILQNSYKQSSVRLPLWRWCRKSCHWKTRSHRIGNSFYSTHSFLHILLF